MRLTGWNDWVVEKIIEAFLSSVKNQKVFDELYYGMFNLSPADFHGIPRPSKWAGRGKYFILGVRYSAKFFVPLWSYVFAYFYVVARILIYYLKSPKAVEFKTSEGVALLVCDRSYTVLSKELSTAKNMLWLIPDGVSLLSSNSGSIAGKSAIASSILSFKEVVLACVYACRAHRLLVKEYGASFGSQSYILPSWIISYLAILKIRPIWIATAEHHDRWAVMADCYSDINPNKGCAADVVLVQHGLEHAETYSLIDELTNAAGLPYRLRHVKLLYLFDDKQREIFFANIISPSIASDLIEVRTISSSLHLQHVAVGKFSVLIVGHPICEIFHVELWQSLEALGDMVCFYKPHPAAKEGRCVHEQSWTFIKDPKYYPEVDLVISYPSTLVTEYADFNISALIHPLDESNSNVSSYVDAVMRKFLAHPG